MRKSEKRLTSTNLTKSPMHDLALMYVKVLIEGETTTLPQLDKCLSKVRIETAEQAMISFLTDSVRLAIETEVKIEWAGKPQTTVSARTPIELELSYSCPVPVRVTDYKFALSNSVTFVKEPEITDSVSASGSWLLTLNPVLSGTGIIGPFKLTLKGERLLVHKHSNKLEFEIAKAPPSLSMVMNPERISCGLGDEVVFDVLVSNEGEGPGEYLVAKIELSDGLEISLGGNEKAIQFIGPSEKIRFQVYVRGISMGDELITITLKDARAESEIITTSVVNVG
jgi:hypothetical protein